MKEFTADVELTDTEKAKLEDTLLDMEAFQAWSEKAEPKVRAKLAQLSDAQVRAETQNLTSPEQRSKLTIRDHRSILVDMLLLEGWKLEQRRKEKTPDGG